LTLLLNLSFHEWWSLYWRDLPPRPPLILPKDTYVCDYGSAGITDDCIYLYGLFGVGDDMRKSDLLLMGSSHVKCGLSAGQLSKELSAKAAHPVRVYNVGIAEGFSFTKDVINQNKLRDKPAVIDLFSIYDNDSVSPVADTTRKYNALGAYCHVGEIWAKYVCDWFWDPFLPHLYPKRIMPLDTLPFKLTIGALHLGRFLQTTAFRSWDTGDLLDFWSPSRGMINSQPGTDLRPYDRTYEDVPNEGIKLPNMAGAQLSGQRPHIIYTLLPFDGYKLGIVPKEAQPFVPIAPEGLTLSDGLHLTELGRKLATERLMQGLQSQGIIVNLSK